MAGVTDVPFRALAWQFGVGYMVGEMVSASDDLWHTQKSRLRRRRVAQTQLLAVQVAGAEPQIIAAAAGRHWEEGADIIDINFGCPAKKVCRKAAGSALLADPELVAQIIRAAVAAVPIPVTVKIRTGFSPLQKNGIEIAAIAEAEGAAAISVHGRTRACRFLGQAEHDTVAAIKARVNIPVFANGDITDEFEAQKIITSTGVDGVMIGRAALGAPWLPGQIAGAIQSPGLEVKLATMVRHVRSMHEFYGEPGIRIARKHVMWYLQKLTEFGSEESRRLLIRHFNKLIDAQEQLTFLQRLEEAARRPDTAPGGSVMAA
jgi:tRNA-dihydrouridine synthase B